MPVMPGLDTGLVPLGQWLILPPLGLWLWRLRAARCCPRSLSVNGPGALHLPATARVRHPLIGVIERYASQIGANTQESV